MDVCLDEHVHYPEWKRLGKITQAEFEKWKSSLTDRELNGYFEQKTHHMMVRLDSDEIDLFATNPEQLIQKIMPKVEARLELDAQFQIQHRHAVQQHDVTQHFKEFTR